jgi:hypothetical protein
LHHHLASHPKGEYPSAPATYNAHMFKKPFYHTSAFARKFIKKSIPLFLSVNVSSLLLDDSALQKKQIEHLNYPMIPGYTAVLLEQS